MHSGPTQGPNSGRFRRGTIAARKRATCASSSRRRQSSSHTVRLTEIRAALDVRGRPGWDLEQGGLALRRTGSGPWEHTWAGRQADDGGIPALGLSRFHAHVQPLPASRAERRAPGPHGRPRGHNMHHCLAACRNSPGPRRRTCPVLSAATTCAWYRSRPSPRTSRGGPGQGAPEAPSARAHSGRRGPRHDVHGSAPRHREAVGRGHAQGPCSS